MQARFLLGPSGSGKTYRCMAEARAALQRSPTGPPLVILAPKQATFQLERQLLAEPGLAGYSRLHILSFDRLAEFILTQFDQDPPQLLSAEGRLMVLRALLGQKRNELKLFRAAARLRGFAQELSMVLRELQRAQLSPDELLSLGNRLGEFDPLNLKLQDLASVLRAYQFWLEEHHLKDEDQLLSLAAEVLRAGDSTIHFEALWFDGFAELAPQEMEFLLALLPFCDRAALAFNLDRESVGPISWLSTWASVGQTFRELHQHLAKRGEIDVAVEWLERDAEWGRFVLNPVLQHLERNWSNAAGGGNRTAFDTSECHGTGLALEKAIRVAICTDPEAEATLAAREILRFVRAGGQYRQSAVIVRNLESYSDAVRRVFSAFEIPFFLDRREPVGHHPFAELTRSALRTIAFHWEPEDWFAALKTGLVSPAEAEIDRLENEALARGWKGNDWLQPLMMPDSPELAERLERLRQKLVAPFEQLAHDLGTRPSGTKLAQALAQFWERLAVGETLQSWSAQPITQGKADVSALIHATLWQQMIEWLENIALAFAQETLSLREWLPVLDAALASQTVGVIPPTLDQVLVGAIDRSRNPDLKLALILGMNESVFPATPQEPNLLTVTDREQLMELGVRLGATSRQKLAQERYLGYVACTRARDRLVITCALRDANDQALNPSPFIDQLQRLFPTLKVETVTGRAGWDEVEHSCELLEPALHRLATLNSASPLPKVFDAVPSIARFKKALARFQEVLANTRLSPALAECLYGTVLETSVSRLEEYAACPFRFALRVGLHAEERKLFQLDARQQGSFQHEVLAKFHQQLRKEGKRWRDLGALEARARIGEVAAQLIPSYQDGLLQATEQSRFTAASLVASLQECIATIIDWMPQYQFDPDAVELAFGIEEKPLAAWEMDLGEGHRLSFRGKIDRVDLWRDPADGSALCVVIDYKSSLRRLDPVLMAHGIQMQLLAYLNVLRALENPEQVFKVKSLIPAGVFFVNLRGRYSSAKTRQEALDGFKSARALAYQHTGRFDVSVLRKLDCRPEAEAGDQFNYRFRKDGKVHGGCREAVDTARFGEMLDGVENHLQRIGREIYAGTVKLDPYRKGATTACDLCEYRSVCRIDPWTHPFRVLAPQATVG